MSDTEDQIRSVQLNPQILKNVHDRFVRSTERVMLSCLYEFYRKLFIRATTDATIDPVNINPLNIFIQRVDKIPIWPEKVIENTTTALREFAEDKYKFFNLHECLKRVLSTQLCQSAALQNKACSSRIQLNDIHIREFLYNLLKLTSVDVSNAPQLFVSSRGKDFIQRERGFDFILKRAIHVALVDFVELFLYRVAQGEIESPFVAIPEPAVTGDQDEAVAFKEVGEGGSNDVNPFSRIEENEENEESMGGGEEEEEGENEEEEDEALPESFKSGEVEEDSEKPWSIDEGPRGRYNDDDDLRDDERRNPRQLSFDDKVVVKEFDSEEPVSILKNNSPSRIYKTKFNPDA